MGRYVFVWSYYLICLGFSLSNPFSILLTCSDIIAFADNVLKNREGLQRIKIDNIVLPTAPFFENKLLPILINNNDTLISLSLSSCGLGSDGINLLAKFIKKNKVLSVLDLSGNMIVDVGSAKSLALAIKKHPELCFLDLSKCNLGGTKIVGHSRGTYSREYWRWGKECCCFICFTYRVQGIDESYP